ncbi:UNVERIFIED_CONTAM: hypothetical protein GTU68_063156 [Idotea baltica]|nr:hypothetical protein [Idotea baltica]
MQYHVARSVVMGKLQHMLNCPMGLG